MLGQFVDAVKKIGVTNFLVVAIDQATSDFLNKRGVANYVRPLRTRSGSTDNHATSGEHRSRTGTPAPPMPCRMPSPRASLKPAP